MLPYYPMTKNRFLLPTIREGLFAVTAILILLLIIYSNSFHAPFHYDDFLNITDNPNIHLRDFSLDSLKNILYGKNLNQTYDTRPLSYLTFALNYYISRNNTFGYHIVNFTIHFFSSILLFLLIHITLKLQSPAKDSLKTIYPVALLSTCFWASHPIQVTAVTYIVQRMASMSAMFYILSMLFFIFFRVTAGTRRKGIWFSLSVFAGIFALAGKENALMLPVSIFLYDVIIIQGLPQEKIKKNILIFLVILTSMMIFGSLLSSPSSVLNGYKIRYFSLMERLLTEPRVILFYISLLLYPVSSRFTLLHDIEISRDLLSPWSTLPSIALLCSLLFIGAYSSRKHPVIGFGILFFLINHLIEGTFLPLELIYEHRNYLPSIFFFLIFAIMLSRPIAHLSKTRSMRILFLIAGIILLAAQSHTTYLRNNLFLSGVRLWQDNSRKAPNLSTPLLNLGRSLWELGRWEESIRMLEKAEHLNRFNNKIQHRTLLFNKALHDAYITRQYTKARSAFEEALRINNGSPYIWAELSRIHMILGDRQKATNLVKHALSFWPDNPDLLFAKSVILFKQNKLDSALETIQKIIKFDPDRPEYWIAMAEIYRGKKEWEKSIAIWNQVSKLNPDFPQAHFALIELHAQLGESGKCRHHMDILMKNARGVTISELIRQSMQNPETRIYLPDPAVLDSAIQSCQKNQQLLNRE